MPRITHEQMLEITKDMPMKLISIEKQVATTSSNPIAGNNLYLLENKVILQPYLERYYAGTFADGSDLWFHHFLRNDAERHLHCHPFDFRTKMLCGGYTEEYLKDDGEKDFRITLPDVINKVTKSEVRFYIEASENESNMFFSGRTITVFDWHRIAAVEPDTWTMMVVQPKRLPFWFFKDDNGETISMKASPKEWWHDFKPRAIAQ